jgi:ABC-type uncharacterized transport system substrate-binding protein
VLEISQIIALSFVNYSNDSGMRHTFVPTPVEIGLVANFNRPGGNATGISSMNAELGSKRLGLLHELLPRAARFAVLLNPNNRSTNAKRRLRRSVSKSKF